MTAENAETVSGAPTVTFEEVILNWYNANRLRYKGATDTKYNYLISRHILPELGSVPAKEINAAVISNYVYKKTYSGRLDGKGGLSPSYVRTISYIIGAAVDFGVLGGMIPPLKGKISNPPVSRHDPRILDRHEQRELEKYLLCNMDETALGIYITLYTGLRIGEVCALSWEDIDLDCQLIHVRNTVSRVRNSDSGLFPTSLIIDRPKTKSSFRLIPISSRLLPVLIKMKSISRSQYVVSSTDSFVSPRTYEYRYHKLLKTIGLSPINYHSLRHTFATRCIESGVDNKTLSEILGHSNVYTTMNIYVHSSMELKRLQLEKVVI